MSDLNPNKLKAIGGFLKNTARESLATFLFLLAVAAAAAAFIFFNFQQSSAPDNSQETVVPAEKTFGAAQEKKFREIFDAIERRRDNGALMATSTFPEVFAPPAEK